MLQVYLDPRTVNSRKVLAGLDLLGTPFELNFVKFFTMEHKDPEYLEINPNGAVPSASDGSGFNITGSNAILQYAADFPNSNSTYSPKDLRVRADVNKWLLCEASVWFPSCYVHLVEYVVKQLLKSEVQQSIINNEAPKWNKLAGVLDAQLAKTGWLAGDELTIADIAVAAPMHLWKASRLPVEKYGNLQRWMEAVEKLPCWVKTQDPRTVRANLNRMSDVENPTEIYFYEPKRSSEVEEITNVSSIHDEAFFELYLQCRNRNGENYLGPASKQMTSRTRRMTMFIILITNETEMDERAQFLGHSAFDNPTSEPDARTRQSIEIGTIALL
ncbi:uncharacterized protein L3040_005612 [Drepanopeziza brunnea f. sp. 'multigermtubi']|uniref:uncharacterized protein n=1 Tax=Drepanopeziza brunnea f. sp. 'multigermtubi' TaxID=698441 RepID=UPI00239A9AC5|nr:hypothetical protein L3040_005612 [Drepanopeziza brunnea f. sp. 'multigermtubi']